jgi:integrase/recombinase XerD
MTAEYGSDSSFPALSNSEHLLLCPYMRVEEAYKLFLVHGQSERQYAKETIAKLRDCFSAWILPELGARDPEALSRMDIMNFRAALVMGKLGVNRQYSILMAMKVFLKFCRRVLKLNCLDPDTEISLPRRPKPHVHYLTNEEVDQVSKAIRTNTFSGLRMRVLVEVLLTTGLRISEALSLDRQPFEQGQTEVSIIGKGGKLRTVFFPQTALEWIRRWLYFRDDDYPAVFVTTGIPRRLDRYDISKYFKDLKIKAGIDKPLTPHILRHTFCTNLRNNGADISLIKELAGHEDIQTTAKYYLGIDRRVLKEAVSKYLNYKSPPQFDRNSSNSYGDGNIH